MSRKTRPRCAIAAIARGPAAVNNCDPILNQRTTPRSRSASASASSSAGTSSATISRSRGSARVPRRSAIDHRSIRAPHRCVALQAVIHERLHGRPVAPSAPHTVRPGAEETELVAAGVQALEQGERLLAADRSTALRDCREHGAGIVDAGRVPVLERVAVTLIIGNTFEIRSRRRDGCYGGSGDQREHACGDQLHRCLPPWSGPQASVNADGQSRPCPMDSADENSPGCPPLLGRVTVCAQAAWPVCWVSGSCGEKSNVAVYRATISHNGPMEIAAVACVPDAGVLRAIEHRPGSGTGLRRPAAPATRRGSFAETSRNVNVSLLSCDARTRAGGARH